MPPATPTPGSSGPRSRIARPALLALLAGALIVPPSASAQTGGAEAGFRLEQNFPNPFTPGVSPTIFTYRLENEAHVRLTVYNLLAQEVAVLVDQRQGRGLHRVAWDGQDMNGEPVPAGVYWYKLEAGDQTALMRLRVRAPSAPPGAEEPIQGMR
ncbi:MAG TPA: FlgD immunoglobulin-like domain containing protein [Gemmatimonadota bacterium]|nr:FlgD immunoglobulin-like domain containing protein [Gemmatimonadota bacterium]